MILTDAGTSDLYYEPETSFFNREIQSLTDG